MARIQLMMGVAAAATLTAMSAAPAHAQAQAQAASETSIGEVIVTAQRRAERLQDVPIAVSAVGGSDLQARGVSNLEQLSSTLPNVNITQNRASGVVTIRGIGFAIATAGADPGVAVHQDGVYISRPPAALAGFYDVERLEIARGPQGTLYGRNATGGAANIITRAPTADPSGYVSASYGNYNAINVDGAVSGPIIADKLLGRLSFQTQDHDGYGTNLFTGHPVDDLRTRAIRGRLTWLVTDDLTVNLSADYFKENDANFATHFWHFYVPCAPGAASRCATDYGGHTSGNLRDTLNNEDTQDNREFYGSSIDVAWNLGSVTLHSLTAYRRYAYDWLIDADATQLPWVDTGRRENTKTFQQEFTATGKFGKLDYVAGLFYFHENNAGSGFGTITEPFPGLNIGLNLQNGTQVTKAGAIFGQATYHFTDQLDLTVGGRYSKEKKTLEDETIGPAATARPRPDRSATFDRFTPMATLSFKFTPDIMAYATYQQGFKSGGFAIGAGTPPFQPEYIKNYEAGVKTTWLEGRLRANVSAFKYDYTNLQVGFTQGLVTVITNAAAASLKGAEFEGTFKPMEGLTIEGNAAYLDAKFDRYFTTDPNRTALGLLDLSGNHLPYAPKVTAFIAAQYEWPALGGTMTIRGEHTYSAKTYFDGFNLGSDVGPAYQYSNLFLRYESGDKNWQVEGFLRNLENKTIINGSTVASSIFGTPVFVNLMPPRIYGVKLTRNF